jgi:beta-N-acetylhexosaminidase
MIGFDGTRLPTETIRLIKEYKIGGVILFRRNVDNPSQIFELCQKLQRLSTSYPLLIAVDHEGGRVCRLPPPFTQFPSSLALGRCRSFSLTYAMAEVMAKELKAVGINMNLAPVLDVNTHPQNPVIGDRSFGNSPTLVSTLGLAVIAGLQDLGVIACGKHFPGHGDTVLDSHQRLPVVSRGLRRLQEIELKPFSHAIANRLASVMTAHVLYPALDPKYPATLSKRVIQALLRTKMGYEGLVLSDDLEMGAITDQWDVSNASVRALLAGVDLLLICHDIKHQRNAIEAVKRAVVSGKVSEKRLNTSIQRILRLKERFLMAREGGSSKEAERVVGCAEHREVAERVKREVALITG